MEGEPEGLGAGRAVVFAGVVTAEAGLGADEARRRVAAIAEHDNHVWLHSPIGYVTPTDKLKGPEPVISAQRDRKLEEARQRRRAACPGSAGTGIRTGRRSAERGYDGRKTITERKRHIAVDTLGLLPAVVVTAAGVVDAVAARDVFRQL